MTSRLHFMPAVGAGFAAVLLVGATMRLGPIVVVGILVILGAGLLVSAPAAAIAVAIGLPILVEPEPDWGPSATPSRLYDLIPGARLDPVEALILLAVAAVVLDRTVTRAPLRHLGIQTAPIALLALALVAGAVTGYDQGVGVSGIANSSRTALLVLIVPFVVAQVVGARIGLKAALGGVLALAAFKGVAGVAALATGQTAATLGEQALTYYYAPTNALMMFALLFCATAAMRRLRLPLWAWAAVPFMAAALLLSYRRSFWVATVMGLVLVLLFAAGRQSRRLGIPAVAAVGLALFLTIGAGLGSGLTPSSGAGDTGLRARLASLNPAAVAQSKDDRYRTGERRNVLAGLRDSPVAGLGLGVDYRARYPLSIGNISHDYVHFAALWWWMKTGVLGLIGYLSLIGCGVWAGVRVFRRHPDGHVRAAGLAAAAGLGGFAVAETTATFVGPDARSCVLIGAIIGLLAVADREARAAEPPGTLA